MQCGPRIVRLSHEQHQQRFVVCAKIHFFLPDNQKYGFSFFVLNKTQTFFQIQPVQRTATAHSQQWRRVADRRASRSVVSSSKIWTSG